MKKTSTASPLRRVFFLITWCLAPLYAQAQSPSPSDFIVVADTLSYCDFENSGQDSIEYIFKSNTFFNPQLNIEPPVGSTRLFLLTTTGTQSNPNERTWGFKIPVEQAQLQNGQMRIIIERRCVRSATDTECPFVRSAGDFFSDTTHVIFRDPQPKLAPEVQVVPRNTVEIELKSPRFGTSFPLDPNSPSPFGVDLFATGISGSLRTEATSSNSPDSTKLVYTFGSADFDVDSLVIQHTVPAEEGCDPVFDTIIIKFGILAEMSSRNTSESIMNIFPNPASSKIRFSHPSRFAIKSRTGEIVKTGEGIGTNVSELPASIYFIFLENDRGSVYQKLIIE